MNVASAEFLIFGAVVAIIYNIYSGLAWRQASLLIANFAFLASFSTAVVAWWPYVAFLALGYLGYLGVRGGRIPLAPLIAVVLVMFFWLKKYTFLPAASFLTYAYVTLGMSYVLFRMLHVLIDAKDGAVGRQLDPITYLNYTLNFTAIISGPIQRFEDYAATQLVVPRPRLDIIILGNALERVIIGFFKIAVLGAALQAMDARLLGDLQRAGHYDLWYRTVDASLIIAIYPFFLYCNFSGYTDMVIGVARWFRLELPENFDRPFTATSFLEFWSRWHISLSSWLKTYVYGPLLKSLMERFQSPRLIPYLGVFAFFVTFFLIGAWHGRTSVFLFFGILQGAGVSINKLYQIVMAKRIGKKAYRDLAARPWYQVGARGLTFTYFAFSLIWFWSNWQQMGGILTALGTSAVLLGLLLLYVSASVAFPIWDFLRNSVLSVGTAGRPLLYSRYVRVAWATALVVVIVSILTLLSMPAPDVVYKAF